MSPDRQYLASPSEHAALPAPDGLSFHVEDMSCGHCAGAIKQAIEAGLPGAKVAADPVSKLVTVTGVEDYAALRSIVTDAGYTPSAAPVAA